MSVAPQCDISKLCPPLTSSGGQLYDAPGFFYGVTGCYFKRPFYVPLQSYEFGKSLVKVLRCSVLSIPEANEFHKDKLSGATPASERNSLTFWEIMKMS